MEEGTHFKEFVRTLLTALNDSHVDYLLVGGVAAVHYGRSRSTMDCDIILSLQEGELDNFYRSFKSKGFEIREYDVKEGFKDKSHFNSYLKGCPYRVDFSWKRGSLANYSFERAKIDTVLGVIAKIETPEDLIIAKLIYGSEQDLDDAAAVLSEQKNLDMAYLKKRAHQEGVAPLLESTIKKAKE